MLEKRFWSKVDKSGDCWEWIAFCGPDGYGRFQLDGKAMRAHRIAYMLKVGQIPGGMLVCHTCDNPSCVKPQHLFIGTHSDNRIDCVKKNRHFKNRGSKHGMAKHNEMDVKLIRIWLRTMYTHQSIADAFGVSRSNISQISRGEIWGNIDPHLVTRKF